MKSWWIILLGVFSGLCAYAQPVADRLLNPDSIQRIFLQDPDRALQLLDTAEQRDLPTLQPFDIAILRAMAYDVKRQYTQIEHYAQLALKDDSVRLVPKRRLRVMSLLLDAQGSLSKYDKCIKVCQEAVELARSLGNVKLEGRILLKMANVYFPDGASGTDRGVLSGEYQADVHVGRRTCPGRAFDGLWRDVKRLYQPEDV